MSGTVPLQQELVEMPFAIGDVIAGKYEVLKQIGSGGMGYVVSAMHVELGEVVALKFLRPEALQIEELVERFAREARAAAKIRSEHVARVYDVGTLPDGVPFIVMEHLHGQDLADVLQQNGPLPVKQAIEYVMQACEALAAAHAAGVVHRDIKPENLFLTKHAQGLDVIKILDFGISKVALAPGKRGFVRTMMPLGSPVYMSPEQIRSSDLVDARTDIWSLGCVLFELLTGTTAFNEPTLMQLSASILEHDPVPLREYVPDAPVELEEIVLRCLEKDADQRFSNVAELAIALYPFAPRRSRISAERCYHALKAAGIDCPEFDLQSEYPPSLGDGAMPSSGAPGGRMTGAASGRISIQGRAAMQGSMSSGSMRISRGTPSRRMTAAEPRTSAPATLELDEAAELESLRPSKKYKVLGLVAILVAAAAGAFFVLQSRATIAGPGGAAAASPVPASTAQLNAATPSVKPTQVLDLDDLPVAPGSPGAATAASAGAHPRQSASPRRAPNTPAAKGTAAPRKHDGDEPDVGY